MSTDLSLGEYVRRLRRKKQWGLQECQAATGISVSHLSRIENDNAVPAADTVVRLSNALDGDLELMLSLADCLPKEILERLVRRADDGEPVLRRSAGGGEPVDPHFPRALVEDMDPHLRRQVAQHFGLTEADAEGIFAVLQRMARMPQPEREAVIAFLSPGTEGHHR